MQNPTNVSLYENDSLSLTCFFLYWKYNNNNNKQKGREKREKETWVSTMRCINGIHNRYFCRLEWIASTPIHRLDSQHLPVVSPWRYVIVRPQTTPRRKTETNRHTHRTDDKWDFLAASWPGHLFWIESLPPFLFSLSLSLFPWITEWIGWIGKGRVASG